MVRKFVFAVLLCWPTMGRAAVPALCGDAPNQLEGTRCAQRKRDAAEASLARTYAALEAKLDASGRRNLDRAEAAWLAFRELECRFETGFDADHPDRNGTIAPMLTAECAVDLTERRTRDLAEQTKCPGGDLSCTP